MTWGLYLAVAAAVFAASWAGTGLARRLLVRRGILDRPNARSSHRQATPRGGGIAVVAAILIAWAGLALARGTLALAWPPLAGALLLALVSWRDDLAGLGPLPRLAAQALAVGGALAVLPLPGPVFHGLLPAWADLALTALAWLWFVNLYNFMDGIDGLAGGEAAAIGIGLFLVAIASGGLGGIAGPGLIVAAAALGFLPWNWHPARIFLGDVGSVPLGYLLGWLLLWAAAEGAWAATLLLPLYFLADATLTLARRLARGARPWRAHREHVYQRAVVAGRSHAAVAGAVMGLNAFLIAAAVASVPWPAWAPAALGVGALSVAALLCYLSTPTAADKTDG